MNNKQPLHSKQFCSLIDSCWRVIYPKFYTFFGRYLLLNEICIFWKLFEWQLLQTPRQTKFSLELLRCSMNQRMNIYYSFCPKSPMYLTKNTYFWARFKATGFVFSESSLNDNCCKHHISQFSIWCFLDTLLKEKVHES